MKPSVRRMAKAARSSGICALAMTLATPAAAAQWVYGKVTIVEDYAAYDASLGVLITLEQKTWSAPQPGEPSGQSACTERFSLGAAGQGMDEGVKARMFSMLLTAASSQRSVGLYVDTTNRRYDVYCRVIITSYGRDGG